jgi:hypothetical protein
VRIGRFNTPAIGATAVAVIVTLPIGTFSVAFTAPLVLPLYNSSSDI